MHKPPLPVPCLLIPVLLLAGCASQGPLRPPSLNLPAAVRHLEAARTGGFVDLSWDNPTKTSDGVLLTARHGAGTLQVEICRLENTPVGTCAPFVRVPARSGGPGTLHDVLPDTLAAGPVHALYYRVRVVNAQGKGAAWSQVTTAAGAAPAAVREMQAYPVANGIVLRWRPVEGDVMLRVSRGADANRTTLLRVQAPATGGQTTHPPQTTGTLDTGGHAGEEQRYVAFRQQPVQFAGETVIMQSDSVALVVPAGAKLPLPAPPSGLEAVANTLGTPEVDLVWQPPDDPSVTGYRVYRQDGEGDTVLLTPQPLQGFTYADKTAQPGHGYRYTVAAVNSSGERRSAPVSAALP